MVDGLEKTAVPNKRDDQCCVARGFYIRLDASSTCVLHVVLGPRAIGPDRS